MNTQNLGYKILVGLALVVGLVALFKTPVVTFTDAQIQELRTSLGSGASANNFNQINFQGGITVGMGVNSNSSYVGPSIWGVRSGVIATSSASNGVFCIIPITATSTISARLQIGVATSTTLVIGLATTTNPYATSTLTSLLTTTWTTGQTPLVKYSGGNNIYVTPNPATPLYLIWYYTSGTTQNGASSTELPASSLNTCVNQYEGF